MISKDFKFKTNLLNGSMKPPLKKWVDHLESFMKAHQLFPSQPQRPCLIALSGGADSLALLFFLVSLRARGHFTHLKAVYIDHKWRERETTLIEGLNKLCVSLNVEFIKTSVSTMSQNNREAHARDERFKVLNTIVKTSRVELVYLGQHIDDSYEWHLLQSLRSGELKTSLGIPLIRGVFRRPLMCFTRKQIENFHQLLGSTFYNDPSNYDLSLSRNWLRFKVIPLLKEKHPSLLKHYVSQMNSLKELLIREDLIAQEKKLFRTDRYGGILLNTNDYNSDLILRESLKRAIYQLSKLHRGKLSSQLNKLIDMLKKDKWGPLTFSGGVTVFCHGGFAYIIGKDLEFPWSELTAVDYCHEGSQIPNEFSNDANWKFPFLIKIETKKKLISKKGFRHNLPSQRDLFKKLEREDLYFNLKTDDTLWLGSYQAFREKYDKWSKATQRLFESHFELKKII